MKNITNEPITSQDVVFSVLYSFIVLAGVAGNITVLVIVRRTPAMHTVTNFLLANLAIADLLTLLFCPGMYDFALKGVKLSPGTGKIVCKLFAGNAIVPVPINASITTLCTVAVERYLALVKPFATKLRLTKARVKYAIGAIWAAAVGFAVFDFKDNTYEKDGKALYPCDRPWKVNVAAGDKEYVVIVSICQVILPFLIIFFCYWQIVRGIYCTRTVFAAVTDEKERLKKIKLCKLLILLAGTFTTCCLPFAVFFVILSFASPDILARHHYRLYNTHRAMRFLLFSNSFVNPLLYAMQSSNYRHNFKRMFCKTQRQNKQNMVPLSENRKQNKICMQ